MASVAVVGATGLVGTQILTALLSLPSISSIHSLSRKEPSITDPKLHAVVSSESSEWSTKLSAISPHPSIFISSLGCSRAKAGSVAAQRLIDYEFNLTLAKAARASGTKVYVFISSAGASASSVLPYPRMKGELEAAVQKLGFDTVVILRPGLLLGDRTESRPAEFAARKLAGLLGGMVGTFATDFWAQDVATVGRAAASAAVQALRGGKGKVWELGQADIVRLGRTEWKA